MSDDKVSLFITSYAKYFPANKLITIKDQLTQVDDSKLMVVMSLDYKDPMTMLLISIFLGHFGVDRFMLGDIGIGLLKLFTMGLCGILTIIDWITITDMSKEKNFQLIMMVL